MMDRKFYSFFAIALACVFCFGMASAPEKNDTSDKDKLKIQAENVLSMLRSGYESRDTQKIAGLMDKDFSDYLSFIDSLDTYFQNFKEIKLRMIMDSFLTDDDKVHARLHWFKSAMDETGSLNKTEGVSEFIFKRSDKGLKLLNILRDNPFF